jgi:hypothetical protein
VVATKGPKVLNAEGSRTCSSEDSEPVAVLNVTLARLAVALLRVMELAGGTDETPD